MVHPQIAPHILAWSSSRAQGWADQPSPALALVGVHSWDCLVNLWALPADPSKEDWAQLPQDWASYVL